MVRERSRRTSRVTPIGFRSEFDNAGETGTDLSFQKGSGQRPTKVVGYIAANDSLRSQTE